ncbi:unnamed protein product [Moneuplotes crassus]|uniref:Uncharacterized protein n=1 Tax=Euplotes crassus TaxID=5936 RepID=A0AAD1Y3E8_EUPCR|nr:unnamed protein product [Moneuplotes crassus]
MDWRYKLKKTIVKQGIIGNLENYTLETDGKLKEKIDYFYKGYNNSINYKKWMEFKEEAQSQTNKEHKTKWKEISKLVKDDLAIDCFKPSNSHKKKKENKRLNKYSKNRNKNLLRDKSDTEKLVNFSNRKFTSELRGLDQFKAMNTMPLNTTSMQKKAYSEEQDSRTPPPPKILSSPQNTKILKSTLVPIDAKKAIFNFKNQVSTKEFAMTPPSVNLNPIKDEERGVSLRKEPSFKIRKKRRLLRTRFKGFTTQNPFLDKVIKKQRDKSRPPRSSKRAQKSMKINISKEPDDNAIDLPLKTKRNRVFSADIKEIKDDSFLFPPKVVNDSDEIKPKVRRSFQNKLQNQTPNITSPDKEIYPDLPDARGTSILDPSELQSFLESSLAEDKSLLLQRPSRILSPKPRINTNLIRMKRTKRLTKASPFKPYLL